MTISNISQLNTSNAIIKPEEEEQKVQIVNEYGGQEFLSLTSRFGGPITGMKLKDQNDVLSGNVENEINKLQSEQEQINNIIQANVNSSLPKAGGVSLAATVPVSSKTIGFVEYTGPSKNIKQTTDTTNILANFQADPTKDYDRQKKVFDATISTMVEWLDGYINNYDERVKEGLKAGEAEGKLSFLLRIRQSIENCDFPVGFAAQSMSVDANGNFRVVGGSYNWRYNKNEYLNTENAAYTNRGAEHDTDRKLLLNTDVFAFEPKYANEADAIAAINAKGSMEWTDIVDLIFSNEDTYIQYVSASLAAVFVHELVHSTHINNEAITYLSCEMVEDDLTKQIYSSNYSDEAKELASKWLLNGKKIDLDNLAYNAIGPNIRVPKDTGGYAIFNPSFGHNLTDIDSIAAHGHDENMAYSNYQNFSKNNTLEYDKKELLNFAVTA